MQTGVNDISTVVVNILVNSQSTQSIQGFNKLMDDIAQIAKNTARQSRDAFNSSFGANFFADLAANLTRQIGGALRSLAADAIKFSSQFESAFAGLGSIARNVGLSAQDTVETVRNLKLVQSGLLTVGEAAESVKNLLATGFSLAESIDLIKRFGDTAAFGRQRALSFGRAIASATEGIKNQNSLLVDNAGVTKNLSVILKESGFQIQDLSDKLKGAAARQALYSGLVKETALQQGDANKLLETTQGRLTQIGVAYERFAARLGDVATQSELVKAGLGVVVTLFDVAGNNIGKLSALAAALGLLTAATLASTTSFASLTAAQTLNAIGSTRVVAGISNIIKAMAGLRAASQLTAGTIAVATGGIGALVLGLGTLAVAIYEVITAEKEKIKVTESGLETLIKQRDLLNKQSQELKSLESENQDLSTTQSRLTDIYESLNAESRTRVDVTELETTKTAALRAEVEKLANARSDELKVTGRVLATDFIKQIQEINRLEERRAELVRTINRRQERAVQITSGNLGTPDFGSDPSLRSAEQAQRLQAGVRSLSIALENLRNQTVEGNKSAAEFNVKLETVAKSLNITTDDLIKQAVAFGNLELDTSKAIDIKNSFIKTEQATKTAVDATNKSLSEQVQTLDLLERSAFRSRAIKERINEITESALIGTKTLENARAYALELAREDKELNKLVGTQKIANEVSKALNKELDTRPEKVKKTRTEFQRLTDGVNRLNAEVQSFTNLSSREFRLRFRREDLERTRRDFEKIISLRRELGLQIDAPLPTNAAALQDLIENLNRVKDLRNDILDIDKELIKAEDELTVARVRASAQVVDAQTRANKAYFDGIRQRRDAERQLTADLATEFRRREEFATRTVSNIEQAQAESLRDVLRETTDRDTQRLRDVARLQILAGEVFKENPLVKAAAAISNQKPDVSPVVTRLDKSNVLLEQILSAVSVSAQTVSGGVGAIGGGVIANATVPRGLQAGSVSRRGGQVLRSVLRPSRFDGQLREVAGVLASQNNVDAGMMFVLLKATLFRESGGRAGLVSSAGAEGFFQQLPSTQRRLGVQNPNDFRQSALGAGRYLLGGFEGRGGLRRGGIAEAFATYFAGEGGGNRGRRTRQYVTDQVFVFNEAIRRLGLSQPTVPTIQANSPLAVVDVQASPSVGTSSGNVQPASGGGGIADNLSQAFFGLPLNSRNLSDSSLEGLRRYIEAQKELDRLGSNDKERIDNLRRQAVGIERVNQLLNVQFAQTAQLASLQDNINRLTSRETIAVTEALNEAEIERRRGQEQSLKVLIQQEDLINKLRSGDQTELGRIITKADADIATQTATAYAEIARVKNFLERFRANDEKIIEFVNKQREASRANQVRNLTLEVADLESQARNGGRDREIEALRTRKQLAETTVNLGQIESDLERFRKLRGDENFVRETRQASVLQEQTQLLRELAALEDERATADVNQELRERVAIEQELAAIRRDDLKAREDAARATVRINDLTVFHQDRANARVLEHIASMKSLTEIYSDAKIAVVDKVWGGLDSLFGKIFSRIPIVNSILADMVSNITKLALNPLLIQLLGLNPSGSGNVPTGAGNRQGGFDLGNIFRGIFGGGGSGSGIGGTPPFVPNSFAPQQIGIGGAVGSNNLLRLAGGGGITDANIRNLFNTFNREGLSTFNDIGGFGGGGSGSITGQVVGAAAQAPKFSLSQLGASLGKVAPLIGLGLGTGVGGQSIGGQILGGAGGLLAGGILGSVLSGGGISGGIIGSIGSTLGLSAGLTGGLALAAAPLLLLGGFFLNRSKRRREQEQIRTQILNDSKSQMEQILQELRAGNIDSSSALSQAEAVKQNYLDQVSKLSDSKTRRIAIETVRDLDTYITAIKNQGRITDFAIAQDNAIVPTFNSGFARNQFGALPFRRTPETVVAAFTPQTEAVLNRQQIYNLGGDTALARAGVGGFPQTNPNQSRSNLPLSNPNANQGAINNGGNITVIVVADEDAANTLAEKTNGRVYIGKMNELIETEQDDGFVDNIGRRFQE